MRQMGSRLQFFDPLQNFICACLLVRATGELKSMAILSKRNYHYICPFSDTKIALVRLS